MTRTTQNPIEVVVPLSDFPWDGDTYLDFSGIAISRTRPDLRQLDRDLAKDEKWSLADASHFLVFEAGDIDPGELVNAFLLSLWLVRATKTHARMRFEINKVQGSHTGSFHRLLGRFGFIERHIHDSLSNEHLRRATRYFMVLKSVIRRRGRLYQSLVLHSAACHSIHWHVAFLCHCAALEGLLTYSRKWGLTNRLAASFACATHRTKSKRDQAYRRFKQSYEIRSDIMHGRIQKKKPQTNLRSLASLEVLCRAAWRPVLASSTLRKALEGADAQREALFTSLQTGYTPPP